VPGASYTGPTLAIAAIQRCAVVAEILLRLDRPAFAGRLSGVRSDAVDLGIGDAGLRQGGRESALLTGVREPDRDVGAAGERETEPQRCAVVT